MPGFLSSFVRADALPYHFGELGGAWPSTRPRTAVLVGHPGHELRIYGLLELTQPTVFVLTDGTGQAGESRIHSTRRLLNRAGARAGSVCGRYPDRTLYDALLHGHWDLFADLVEEIAGTLVRERVQLVACDEVEGFCSVHETAHLLAQAAVRLARQRLGQPIQLVAFPVVSRPHVPTDLQPGQDLWLTLAEETLQRKLFAARDYPEVASEVQETLDVFGMTPFACEGLRHVDANAALAVPPEDLPFYELHGRKQVEKGAYSAAITYREHVLPLAQALLGRRCERVAA